MPSLQNVRQDQSVKVAYMRCCREYQCSRNSFPVPAKLTPVNVEYGTCDIVGFVLDCSRPLRGGFPTNFGSEEAFLAYPSSRLSQWFSYQSIGES